MRAALAFLLSFSIAGSVAASLAGCSGGETAPPPPPPCQGVLPDAAEGCLTGAYFQGYGDAPFPACAGFTPTTEKIGGRREIALHKHGALSHEDVTTEGRYLQRFYAHYDLTFFTRAPAADVGFAHALTGTNQEFAEAASQAGIVDPRVTPTEEQRAKLDELVGDILFRDLRAFVRSRPLDASRVEVVLLERIASPDVQAQLSSTGVIAGLGVSPVLFRNIAADDPQRDLFAALQLPEAFTATLFVGHADVVKIAQNPEVIVAHEMGHALGLQHTQTSGNLMTQYQGNQTCIPGLVTDQVEQLRGAAGVVALPEGWQLLLDAKRTIVERAIAGAFTRRAKLAR